MKIWVSRKCAKHQIVKHVFFLLSLCVHGAHSASLDASSFQIYLQPNDVTSGKYDFLSTAEAERKNLCTRPCDNASPMICYYTFVVENYNSVGPACGNCTILPDSPDCNNPQCVTADGVEKPVLTVNRQIPAPSIQVCPGDLIVVDVINKMYDRATTIHWHGLYQKKTPWMDGVPSVTQCPILPGATFRYKFPAVPFGTFFYHSHQGLQKMDGIVGSLVIRRPRSEDPSTYLYDYDLPSHVLLITDWLHTIMDSRLPGNRFFNTGGLPDSILANGRTQYFYSIVNGTKAPYSVFHVTKDKKYRFRIIGGTCAVCPVLITFHKHKLLLIGSDGTPVEPLVVDSIALLAGERFDVVLHANQKEASYWIQLKGLAGCVNTSASYAVLQYASSKAKTSSSILPPALIFKRGVTLNPVDISNCSAATDLCFARLNAAIPPPVHSILKAKPDKRIVLAVDFYTYSLNQLFRNNTYHTWMQPVPNFEVTSLINNLSYVPTSFSLLTQSSPIPQDKVCSNLANCGNKAPGNICECTHIVQVALNSIVELVFIDFTLGNINLAHPLHLHGNDMFIIKQGKIPSHLTAETFLPQLIQDLDNEGPNLAQTRPRPIVKDTIGNLPSGYTVVRVHFNNPGMWYFHCHFILHTKTGMTLVFQVGERYQFVLPPPHFPTCDDFLPAVRDRDLKAASAMRHSPNGNSPSPRLRENLAEVEQFVSDILDEVLGG